MFLFLPGPVSTLLLACGLIGLHLVCWPMQGPSKVWSKTPTDPVVIAKYERVAGERWFFLNGCCVSGHNLQHNVNVLSETFGRPIFAVHNRTLGVLGDLFECISQRSLNLFTDETRVCYEYVKAYCADSEVKKVVLLAHSQGCIMASQILDELYVDLPAQAVSKLEVGVGVLQTSRKWSLMIDRFTHSEMRPPISTIPFVSFLQRPRQLIQQTCHQS